MKNLIKTFSVLMAFMLIFSGCSSSLSSQNAGAQNESTAESSESTVSTENTNNAAAASDMFTDRDNDPSYDESKSVLISLNGSSAQCESSAVSVSGSTVRITDEGTYILTGSLDGMIIVEAEKTDKVQLVLKNVEIESESSAAIYVLNADKVFITLADGTENKLSNGGTFTAIDENNIDAAIFSKDDLTLNGSGSLEINSPAGHGIVSKDDLAVTGGSYAITAASHGISGKDCVKIAAGSFVIVSGKDGIHAENADDTALGYIYISGGSYDITSAGDGISASGYMLIEGGSYNILSGGGSASVTKTSGGEWNWGGMQQSTEDDSVSAKGIKAEGSLTLSGGSFNIDSADDSLHSNANLTVSGGSFELSTGDDGIHSDELTAISGGTINIAKSYEGIEGTTIEISGGEIAITASDDGINAAGGNDQSGFGGFGGFGGNAQSESGSQQSGITISCGTVNVNAAGDGIDSNGFLNVTGGETYVSGPENSANGALDYASSASVTGGIFVAAGASGMAQNFGSESTQGAMLITTGQQASGTEIVLKDSDGNIIVSWKSEKTYGSVVITAPEIVSGGTYELTAGTYSETITMSGTIYGSSGGMGSFGGFGGGKGQGGMKGEMPSDMPSMPDGTVPENGERPDRFTENSASAAA